MGRNLKGKELGAGLNQRKDGRYQARLINRFGKRLTFYSFKLSEVKKWLTDTIYDDKHGLGGDGSAVTLNEWFDEFLKLYKIGNCKESTNYNRISSYNTHIKDTVGKLLLSEIKVSHIQKLLNEMKNNGYTKGTIVKFKSSISEIFEKAIDNDYISKNPCKKAEVPLNCKESKSARVLSFNEEKEFVKAIEGNMQKNWYLIALCTGMRQGEISALSIHDIDFKNHVIHVTKTLSYVGGIFRFNTPKTQNSVRDIPMNARLEKILSNQMERRKAMKLKSGDGWKPLEGFESLIFTTKFGRPLAEIQMLDSLKNIISKINRERINSAKGNNRPVELMTHFSLHSLRHTFASRCIESGLKPKTLQMILGHSDIKITLNIYTHLSQESIREDLEKIVVAY